jgi:hypothetical protein
VISWTQIVPIGKDENAFFVQLGADCQPAQGAAADGTHPALTEGPAALRHADDRYRARPAGPLKSAAKQGVTVVNAKRTGVVSVEQITQSILVFRGHKVLLDEDLAILYGVATRVLLQAVRRNRERFPEDFMVQLTAAEWAVLRSQSVILKTGRGQHRKYLPYAFTEQGVAMLSSVLNSKHAIAINIEIMRAFVKLRDLLSSNRELARRFAQLETRLDKKLTEHDEAIAAILSAIRQLMGKATTTH